MAAALMLGFVALIAIGVPIAFAMGLATLLAIVVHGGMPFRCLPNARLSAPTPMPFSLFRSSSWLATS